MGRSLSTRFVALSLALLVARFNMASGEPGDIFKVSAPVGSNSGPATTPIMAGDATVSSMTGAMSYAYPIQLPPGRLKPSLSLAYSSQAAIYGTIAAGWSLSGVGLIMEDTSGGRLAGGAKKYASSLAGGEQLIQVKEPSVGVAYRAQHDATFTRYERMPSGNFWWRAWSSDGTIYFFGHKDAHTAGCSNVSDGYAPLTRMEDQFGHAVDFIYEPGVEGECRLRAITWGQNPNANIGYYGAVELTYSSINHTCAAGPIGAQTSYRTGTKIVTGASQLDSIRVAAFAPQSTTSVTAAPIPASPEHARTIALKYSTDPAQTVSNASKCLAQHAPYRELLSIQETAVGINAPQVTLPQVDFAYGDASVAYSTGTNGANINWIDMLPFNLGWGLRFTSGNEWPTVEAMMLDVDGDGRVDRLVSETQTRSGGRVFCGARWFRNTGNGFADSGVIAIPTLKWATTSADFTAMPYKGGLSPRTTGASVERCALNFQHTAYRNARFGGGTCNASGSSCSANGYCTPGVNTNSSGYGTDCANTKSQPQGDTYFAWRWFDINGDRRPDLVGSPIRGGLNSYDLQRGNYAPGTQITAPPEPAIFGSFPACPPDRFPSTPSYTSDGGGAYTMCNGMYPWFVFKNNGDGTFGKSRPRVQQAKSAHSPPPHDSWGPAPSAILYQPIPLETTAGDSSINSTASGQDQAMLDIDSDGYADAVRAGGPAFSVWRNDARGTGQLIPQPGTASPYLFGAASTFYLFRTETSLSVSTPVSTQGLDDYNGDGLIDHWVATGTGSPNAYVQLSDGKQLLLNDQFTAARTGADGYPLRIDYWDTSPVVIHEAVRADSRRGLDVDADGRVDIVRFADGSTTPTIQFNHGGKFGSTIDGIAGTVGAFYHYIVANDRVSMGDGHSWEIRSDLIDFDGDGVIDSVDFGTSYSPTANDIQIRKRPNSPPPRLLYQIKNNRGATTTVAYSTLHGSAVTNSARRGIPSEQWVVQSITTHDDFAATDSTVSYKYIDPVFSPSLEGTRTWSFRGFDTVEMTAPSGAKTIERFDFTVDYTGRAKTKLVMPAPSEAAVPGEVRSIDETTWEQRTLFRGAIKTFHATTADHWTCQNGQTEAACRTNTDTRTRTTTMLTALPSTTGPDVTTPLMWAPTSIRSQTSATAADGDRVSVTEYALAADASKYRLRPLHTTRQVQKAGALVTFARSDQHWDSSHRVVQGDVVWLTDQPGYWLVTTRDYDMTTGNVKSVTNPRGNATSYSYDTRKLFVATQDGPGPQDYDYEYDYGTGVKTRVRNPLTAWCAVYPTLSCSGEGLSRSEDRFRYDALGRLLERYISVNRDLSLYEFTLKKVEDTEYVDGIVNGAPPSITKWHAIDDDGTSVRYAISKTEFDGLGRTIRQTTDAQGDATANAVTSYKYGNDGSLQHVAVPDPSASDQRHVAYAYTSDSLGRPTTIRRPDGALGQESGVDFSYDGLTRTSREVVGAAGGKPAATITVSDVFGRVTEVNEQLTASGGAPGSRTGRDSPAWARTTYAYGPDDKVSQIVDPDGVTTTLVHDRAGRRTQITRGAHTWAYGYDQNSNLTSITEPCSGVTCGLNVTTIAYDENDRPTSKVLAQRNLTADDLNLFGASYETFQYDITPNGTGRLAHWNAYGDSSVLHQQFLYTPQGQRTTNIQTFNAAGYTNLQRDSIRRYFWSGRLAETSYRDFVNGGQFTRAAYEYDARGLPSEVWISTTGGSTWTHPPTIETRNIAGLVVTRRTQDLTGSMPSIESSWAYDKLGRVTSQVIQKGPTPTTVARQDVTYFGNDDPATLGHDIGNTHRAFAFTYDQRHQLLTAKETTTSGALFDAQYSYGCPTSTNCTKRGGRFEYVRETSTGAVGGNVLPRDVRYEYAGTDPEQITALVDLATNSALYSYEYDEAGHQTLRCHGAIANGTCSGDSLWFLYDGKGQLRRVTKRDASGTQTGSEEYWYDSDGIRTLVLKRNAAGAKTELIWTIEETETHFDANGTVTKAYSHISLGTPLARVERTSNTSAKIEYQFHGLANNTIATVDQLKLPRFGGRVGTNVHAASA